MRTAGVLAGVVPQLQELLDVGVPGLQVDAGRALAPAALVDRGHGRVQRAQPGHDAVGVTVRTPDEGAARTHPGPGDADASGVLGQPRHLAVPVVDPLQLVARRVEQEAGRELRAARAGVEQGGRAGQVRQRGHEPVQLGRLGDALRQPAGHAQEEVLRPLQHVAGLGVAQQVAVVDGAQPEVLEPVVGLLRDQRVQLGGVRGDESGERVLDQPGRVGGRDRLRERAHALPCGLVGDLLGQQPGGDPGVGRVGDHPRGGLLDGQAAVDLDDLRHVRSPHPREGMREHGSTPGAHHVALRPTLETLNTARRAAPGMPLAGLRARGHARWHLLAVASRISPVRLTAVVPAHRCGAAPESHRVPFCSASREANQRRAGSYI